MPHLDYSGAIAWQFAHGVPKNVTAELFNYGEPSIRVVSWRFEQGLLTKPMKNVASDLLTAGASLDRLFQREPLYDEIPIPRTRAEIIQLEQEIDDFGRHFWEHIRNGEGATRLGRLLRKVSKPKSLLLQRAAARLYHLLAEIYLHAGYCFSSLKLGHRAYITEEKTYKQTLSRYDLDTIAKTCLLISHAFILRTEFSEARPWLTRSAQAFEAAGRHQNRQPYVDPELSRQLAVVQFHLGNLDEARRNLIKAGVLLPLYKTDATLAQVRDVGERFLNFISDEADWEAGFNLKDFALNCWPEGDIHRAINVNWAAGEALSTDSPEAERRAIELLQELGHLSVGYMHQETVTELLTMTPFLPKPLRHDWVKFAFHYNAFRNK